MSRVPNTLTVLDKMRWNAHLNKNCHFRASLKGHRQHIGFGLPVVFINLLLGSVFFAQMGNELPQWAYWGSALLALIAALMSGVQTFFNFRQSYEGHREVGNQYLAVARECERLIAGYFDELLNLEQLCEQIHELNAQYASITQRAEGFIVSDKIYRQSLARQIDKAKHTPSLLEQQAQPFA